MKKIYVFLAVVILVGAGVWYIGNREAKNFSLLPTSSTPSTPAETSVVPALIAQATYNCDGGNTITAAFYKGEVLPVEPGQPPVPTGSVKITLSDGRNFDLIQTISADGGRYANSDESFVFWDKGDTALILENGAKKDYTGCVAAARQSSGISSAHPENKEGAFSKENIGEEEYYYQIDNNTKIVFSPSQEPEKKRSGDVILRKNGEDHILLEDVTIKGPSSGDNIFVKPTADPEIFILHLNDGDLGAWFSNDFYLDLAKNKIVFRVRDDQGYNLVVQKDSLPKVDLGLAVVDNCGDNGNRSGKKAQITDLTLNGNVADVLENPIEIDCVDTDMFGPYYEPVFDLVQREIDNDFSKFRFAFTGKQWKDATATEVWEKEFYILLKDPNNIKIYRDDLSE